MPTYMRRMIVVLFFSLSATALENQDAIGSTIKPGMYYAQIKRLAGFEGQIKGRVKKPSGGEITHYRWIFPDGALLEASFDDDLVTKWNYQKAAPKPTPKSKKQVAYQEGIEAAIQLYAYECKIQNGGNYTYFGTGYGSEAHYGLIPGCIGYLKGSVVQIIDDSSLLLSVNTSKYDSQIVLVKKVSTASIVDDEHISLGMMRVMGTAQYTSVLGVTKKVVRLEPFDITPYRSQIPPAMLKE